ncbi:MAG: hypothetical protein VXX55_03160, partial [Planctomycetota bacterium]|nr:hypothetical protein [Planctomycetota bacterium]
QPSFFLTNHSGFPNIFTFLKTDESCCDTLTKIGQGDSWVVPRSWGTEDLGEINGKKSCVIQTLAKVRV